ncbi:MAG TPA: hypothetical protein VJM50_16855 [Pyrinomonadaceae bacterium]|nr:hypothetical protein [Pyrinomonadaceae bacterium]
MNGLILGLYGVYLVAVAIRGQSDALLGELDKDMPGFIPWVIAIVALIIMAQNEATEKMVKPFVFLLIMNFVLMNFGNISNEVKKLRSLSTGSQN